MYTPPSNIYTKEYYYQHAEGFDVMLKKIKPFLYKLKNIKVLDLGCGSGDLAIYLASRGAYVTGLDYSVDAITLAKGKLQKRRDEIKSRIKFRRLDITKMEFEKNSFDFVISIDVFEHINSSNLEKIMKKISKVLKPNGLLLVHTEPNKFYLDFTHNYYVYPLSTLLIAINKLITKKNYPNILKESRNRLHKIQHVNEPTIFYLRSLFKRYNFKGKIRPLVPYKPLIGWKDLIYNIVVFLYPLSSLTPFSWLFAYDYICVMRNLKKK